MCVRIILVAITLHLGSLSAQSCKGAPPFILKKGYDINRSAISSLENKQRGVVLVEFENLQDPNSRRTKTFQDPSWLICGYAGIITTAKNGNVFVLPKANVNMLFNKAEEQNTIFMIDGITGKMSPWLSLPMTKLPNERNATGLLGSFYDCENDNLIVSTIAGSDQKSEIGRLYSINTLTKQSIMILENLDIMGILILRQQGQKKVFFGLCRRSEIWSIQIDNNNKPISKPKLEIDLSGLGPRGDDKARKLRMNQDGTITIYGVPFYYNLTAPVKRQESIYTYQYNMKENKWIIKSII